MSMNSDVWDTLIKVQEYFVASFDKTGYEIAEEGMDRFNQPGWVNRVWTSGNYRRAHIDVVDARESKGLWMMHCCIFPHIHNPAPIFGFDVVAGKNKITGCFYDFSPAGDNEHPMLDWFAEEAHKLQWNKQRKLPEWAERIFSSCMIAAGNVQEPEELEQIFEMARRGINHYLAAVGETNRSANNTTDSQNFYCENQKMNPHTPKVMVSLGLSEEDVKVFIHDCLFPEIR
jgi:phycocyanobilin:ferredoxin oxidoreductase